MSNVVRVVPDLNVPLAMPFGQTSDFILACVNPPSVFNFYPSLENAAADAGRANGEEWKTFRGSRLHDGRYAPMTWDQFVQAQRTFYLADPPVQITVEKYWKMLECLPPDHYESHGSLVSFLMCEHYSGPYTHQYVKRGHGDQTTYWTRMVDATDRATWMTYESLAAMEAAALDLCMACGVQKALMVKPHGTWQRGECDACASGHHCDRRCGRQARPGSDLCGECGSPA